jgi:hypothetical protein
MVSALAMTGMTFTYTTHRICHVHKFQARRGHHCLCPTVQWQTHLALQGIQQLEVERGEGLASWAQHEDACMHA